MAQTLTLPPGSATLSLWYDTNGCRGWEAQGAGAMVWLKDLDTNELAALVDHGCVDDWTNVVVNLGAHAGHSVTLTLSNYFNTTQAWWDDVMLVP